MEPLGWIHTQPNELPQLSPQDVSAPYSFNPIPTRDGISVKFSRLPMTDILSVLNFTDTDNRYSINCRYIGVLPIYRGKITEI